MAILRLDCPKSPLALRPENDSVRGSLKVGPRGAKRPGAPLWRTLAVAAGFCGEPGAQAVGRAAKPHPGPTSAVRTAAWGGKWGVSYELLGTGALPRAKDIIYVHEMQADYEKHID